MFGAVSPEQVTLPPAPLATTQMFGAPGALGDGARSRSGPMAAAPEAAADSVPPTDRPAAPIQGGALPKIAAMTPAPLPDEGFADTIIRDRSRIPDPASMAPTQMFGAPDEKELERIWQERRSRGSRFPQPDTTEPNVPLYRKERTTDPDNPEAPPIGGEPPTMGSSSPTPIDTPFNRAPTPPETPPAARLELPPEAPELIPEPRTEESGVGEAAELRRRLRRRTVVAAGAVGVVLLVIIGGIAGRALANRRKVAPPELIARREEVHLLLRRDDGASRERAVAALDGMVSSYPEFTLAQADLVVALALQLDDARIQVRRLTAEADDLNRKVARLNEEKVPSDWQNRVNAMTERLGEIQKATNPLMEQVGGIDARLNDRFRALQAIQATVPDDQVALMRAQAVYFGVKGSDQAIPLAERYKNLGGTEGWGSVAVAELALNARVTPDAIASARAAMDELSTKDSTFLRSYVLSARLAMAQKHADSAISGLEAVLALNPSHEVARQLLDWARSGQP
ncbi:MAG TPA: hypothetical protein VND93_06640, partial [Myxococcales bacterium]|nr:hypothetical protein [Myxococcales bacterium]